MVIERSHIFDEVLSLCKDSDGIVIPIPLDHRSHPSNYNLSGIYILLLNNMQKYSFHSYYLQNLIPPNNTYPLFENFLIG